MAKIDSLLKKKGWSGAAVGKALVASVVHDIEHQSEPDYKPLFSQSDFDKMESSLSSERDYLVYGVYRNIYSGLVDAYNQGQGLHQQFYNGYSGYVKRLQDAQTAEKIKERAELIPYVMTESQYITLQEKAEAILKNNKESFSSIIFSTLSYFLQTTETAPEPIKRSIEATKEEPVTNKRILSTYNKTYGKGFYQLPDGTRSDQMQDEEWKDLLKENFLKKNKLYINGESASFNATMSHYSTARRLKIYELYFKGIETVKDLYKEHTGKELPPEQEADVVDALEELAKCGENRLVTALENRTAPPRYEELMDVINVIDGDFAGGAEWHYYEEFPEEITKYDIITNSLCFYNGEESEDGNPQLKEFKADYPDLYEVLEAYIKEALPASRDLKPTQYNKEFISWKELAELGFADYSSLITPNEYDIVGTLAQTEEDTEENLIKRGRIFLNGINISNDPPEYQVNENGEFIDNIQLFLYPVTRFNIDYIAGEETIVQDIIAYRDNLFMPALQYCYAFNALVKVLGAVYDIDGMDKVEINTTNLEKKLEIANHTLFLFYAEVYGSAQDKARKRDLIKSIFPALNYEELKPTDENIIAVAKELEEMGFCSETEKTLKNFDILIARLCERGL